MLIFGTLPGICFAGGMTAFLFDRKIRNFDYAKFAESFRNRIRENAEQLAADAGIQIEFLRKLNFRKEDRVKGILENEGSKWDWCASSRQWSPAPPTSRDTTSRPDKRICFRMTASVCVTISISWTRNSACQVRMPTRRPRRLQICCKGHREAEEPEP
jgi:hypothetical protein